MSNLPVYTCSCGQACATFFTTSVSLVCPLHPKNPSLLSSLVWWENRRGLQEPLPCTGKSRGESFLAEVTSDRGCPQDGQDGLEEGAQMMGTFCQSVSWTL